MVSVDFFTVATIRFQVRYIFLVLAHDGRNSTFRRDGSANRGMDRAATAGGISLGQRAAFLVERPRPNLRFWLHEAGGGIWDSGKCWERLACRSSVPTSSG
jgi:hypothetical protein